MIFISIKQLIKIYSYFVTVKYKNANINKKLRQRIETFPFKTMNEYLGFDKNNMR